MYFPVQRRNIGIDKVPWSSLSHPPKGSLCSLSSIPLWHLRFNTTRKVSSKENKLPSRPAPIPASPFYIPRPFNNGPKAYLKPLYVYSSLRNCYMMCQTLCNRVSYTNITSFRWFRLVSQVCMSATNCWNRPIRFKKNEKKTTKSYFVQPLRGKALYSGGIF